MYSVKHIPWEYSTLEILISAKTNSMLLTIETGPPLGFKIVHGLTYAFFY